MNTPPSARAARPFPETGRPERLAPPGTLDAAQQAAADALIAGPRRGVYGPFRPLLHHPPLLAATARLGEVLRYEGRLGARLREWVICVVARETGNLFEWDMHHPLALAAGVPAAALERLDAVGVSAGPTGLAPSDPPLSDLPPPDLPEDLQLAGSLAENLLRQHRIDDPTYTAALARWGEATLVELLTLVGYFATVCALMNVARTPGPRG